MGSLVNTNIENSNRSKKLLRNVNSNSCGALFKKRKVSATRVFPPGCGPNAPRMYALPRIEKEKKRKGKKSINVSASKSKNLVATIPMMASICIESLNERLLTNGVSFKTRKVSATRVFPRGCGPNAPRIYVISEGREKKKTADKKLVNVPVSDCHKTSEVELILQKLVTNGSVLFKKRKVSATRVFPPGCGPNTPHMCVSPRFEKEKTGADEKQVDFAMSDCSESSDDGKAITNAVTKDKDVLENKTLFENAKSWIPSQWPISTTDILKESLLKIKCKTGKISAMREFPPFCGRNARRPTKEERLEIMGGQDSKVVSKKKCTRMVNKGNYS